MLRDCLSWFLFFAPRASLARSSEIEQLVTRIISGDPAARDQRATVPKIMNSRRPRGAYLSKINLDADVLLRLGKFSPTRTVQHWRSANYRLIFARIAEEISLIVILYSVNPARCALYV